MITTRIDAITKIGIEYQGEIIPAPKSAKIELTADCNYKCDFCVKSIRPGGGQMDRTLYSRIIRELRDAGVEELGLFYIGESFLVKWLPDAIREAKAVGFPYIFLTTNGSAATPDRVRECMDAGLDSLKFSINFSDFQQFEAYAHVGSQLYRKALANAKAARAVRDDGGCACGLYASSIQFDGAQGDAMRAIMEDIRPYMDECYWLPLYGMSGASLANGLQPGPGNPGRVGALRDPLPCWAVFTEAHITAQGKLVACCFGSGMDGDLVMADMAECSFMDGWNSPKYQSLRRAHLAKDVRGTGCEGCVAG